MPDNDLFLQTIDAVYASGLDHDFLPAALDAATRLLGGAGASLEVFDKSAKRVTEFWSASLPTISTSRYIDQYAAQNMPLPFVLRQNAGDLAWDRKFLGEAEMARDPFYADFLAGLGFRYFISAVLEKTPDKLVVVAVQRTRKQGHVDRQEIALMRRLCPHLQRAYDTATRLKSVAYHRGLLENALAWLCDGVALLRADGHVVHANDALLAIAQRGDGFRVANGTVEFPTVEARRHFDAALGATQRIGNAFFDACPTDFPVPRTTGMPAYIMSLRPLVRRQSRAAQHDDAVVMLFVRDPLGRNIVASHMLQELFNLTDAEAHLAQALCTGKTTDAYAEERSVTLNTVYSHLRRIREKTGCKSVPDLIRKFSELNIPLRTN